MPRNNYASKLFQSTKTGKVSDFIVPMLAKIAEKPFDNPEWLFEIKWDGYRAIADLRNGLSLYSRNGLDFAKKFPQIAKALASLKIKAVLDGEIIAIGADGNPSFQTLQHTDEIKNVSLQYQVFDILYLGKKNLMSLSLEKRKAILQKELPVNDVIKYSDHVFKDGIALFEEVKSRGLEGIMAKHKESPYKIGKRNGDWLKVRNHYIEEAIILGYTPPQGNRNYFGSLILGRYLEGKLRWAGQVGTGFSEAFLKELFDDMQKLKTDKNPLAFDQFKDPVASWLKPELVANIKYSEITSDGKFRHPVFMGIRIDKKAKDLK